jgi:phosphoribosylanthranilate isomerase
MIVQIYETQNASEARVLEAVGVDHIGVLVGQGRYAREIRPAKARRIFEGITKARRVALSLADDIEEVIDEQSLPLAQQYDGLVEYLLLDTYQPGETQVGATGAPHDWDLSRRIVRSVHTPVILAGDLGPQNVADAIRTVRPAGVDSKTHTDQDDGPCKDIEQVRALVRIAKSLRLDRGSSP